VAETLLHRIGRQTSPRLALRHYLTDACLGSAQLLPFFDVAFFSLSLCYLFFDLLLDRNERHVLDRSNRFEYLLLAVFRNKELNFKL